MKEGLDVPPMNVAARRLTKESANQVFVFVAHGCRMTEVLIRLVELRTKHVSLGVTSLFTRTLLHDWAVGGTKCGARARWDLRRARPIRAYRRPLIGDCTVDQNDARFEPQRELPTEPFVELPAATFVSSRYLTALSGAVGPFRTPDSKTRAPQHRNREEICQRAGAPRTAHRQTKTSKRRRTT
jgi:hypothetical protein